MDGFQNGFSLQYTGPRTSRNSRNLRSAVANPDILLSKIKKEVNEGRVAGPFSEPPFENLIVSPLGLVPKKQKGEFRMIHHLSYPEGGSINDFIDPKLSSVQYTSFDAAITFIQKLGRNCKLFKMDLKNAFRNLPIHPSDFHLLGFSFNGKFYFDKALVFGASISCAIFERFARFLEFGVKSQMESGELIHYLDDFLGGDKDNQSCHNIMLTFRSIMKELGVPLAEEKTEGPSEVIVFLGLELDTNRMVVRIPQEKLDDIKCKILQILSKQKTTLKELQSLIGSLNFCCRAIIIGRPFCRRLINKTCGLTKPYHHVRVTQGIRLDLLMWLKFFKEHNGVSVFHEQQWTTNADLQLYSDSAGRHGLGFGVVFQNQWAQERWPESWRALLSDITVLELFPIVVALFVWGKKLANKKIMFHCDNMAVVHILNHLSSKSDKVMCLVRVLTLQCLSFNILIKAKHVEGIKNSVCDSLSRFQMSRFRQLAPAANREPTPMPNFLWDIFNREQEIWSKLGLHTIVD